MDLVWAISRILQNLSYTIKMFVQKNGSSGEQKNIRSIKAAIAERLINHVSFLGFFNKFQL